MELTKEFILKKFPHVFSNEFQERQILNIEYGENWGKELHTQAILNMCNDWKIRSAEYFSNLKVKDCTIVLTKNKDGKKELFRFWLNFSKNEWCYSEIQNYNL